MKNVFFKAIAVICFCLTATPHAFAIDANDFLPPVQAQKPAEKAKLLEVQQPAEIKTDPVLQQEVTVAPNLQDAINSIVAKPKQGCEITMTADGGVVFVATGQGNYNPSHENVLASRIEQRNAYVEAFMIAKSEMAKTVGEIVVRGATNFDKKIESLSNEKKTLNNVEKELTETQIQSVRKVLKGFVTYSVVDDGKGRVFVTLVSSPKTRGQSTRNATTGLSAASLQSGLNQLISEIKSGLVPPVGGRIIDVPATGEVAFVGFGSSIVRKDKEADVQAELDLQAEKVAGMRAVDGLAGIIIGDDTSWLARADETTKKSMKDFERLGQDDQSAKGSEAEIKEYTDRVKTLQNSLSTSESVVSLRKGVLPPGIKRITEIDEDGYFAYGIAVYVPSLSNLAAQGSKEMDNAKIVQPIKSNVEPQAEKPVSSADESLTLKKGPSGVVNQKLD